MNRVCLIIGILISMIIPLSLPVLSAEDGVKPEVFSEKATIKPAVKSFEMREYTVKMNVSGMVPTPDSAEYASLEATLSYKIKHQYGKLDTEGAIPLEISLISGEITTGGQTLQIEPNVYPKLTVLIDKNWQISGIYGANNDAKQGLPGINYRNIIMLFYPPNLFVPHSIGETWQAKLKLPGIGETFDFTNTLKSVEGTNNAQRANLHQVITQTQADASVKAIVDSVFSVADGKLLKSHADCFVQFLSSDNNDSKKDKPARSANIKIDIALVR